MSTTGDQVDALVRGPERCIAAFCPTCGGWTMFCVSSSANARDWIRMCYVAGDLIMPVRDPISIGPACPQVDTLLDERTCDQ